MQLCFGSRGQSQRKKAVGQEHSNAYKTSNNRYQRPVAVHSFTSPCSHHCAISSLKWHSLSYATYSIKCLSKISLQVQLRVHTGSTYSLLDCSSNTHVKVQHADSNECDHQEGSNLDIKSLGAASFIWSYIWYSTVCDATWFDIARSWVILLIYVIHCGLQHLWWRRQDMVRC